MSDDIILQNAKDLGYIVSNGRYIALTKRGLDYAEITWNQLSENARLCVGAMLMAEYKTMLERGETASINWPN